MANYLFDGLLGGRETDATKLLRIPGAADWSYADTVAASGRLANLLLASGVGPGDRVMVQVAKSAEAIALYLAAVRAGAVFLPLNTAYTRTEVDYFLDDAEPAVLVCAGDRAPEFDQVDARLFTLDADGGGSLMQAAQAHPAEFETLEADAVLGGERLERLAVLGDVQAAVGEHPIDVHRQQADLLQSGLKIGQQLSLISRLREDDSGRPAGRDIPTRRGRF